MRKVRQRLAALVMTGAIASTIVAVTPAPAQAHGRLALGKYWCYNYAMYPPWPTTSIHFKRYHRYVTPVGATSPGTRGRWSHNPDYARVNFQSGPFAKPSLRVNHVKLDGDWWLRVLVKSDGAFRYAYSCFLDNS